MLTCYKQKADITNSMDLYLRNNRKHSLMNDKHNIMRT